MGCTKSKPLKIVFIGEISLRTKRKGCLEIYDSVTVLKASTKSTFSYNFYIGSNRGLFIILILLMILMFANIKPTMG